MIASTRARFTQSPNTILSSLLNPRTISLSIKIPTRSSSETPQSCCDPANWYSNSSPPSFKHVSFSWHRRLDERSSSIWKEKKKIFEKRFGYPIEQQCEKSRLWSVLCDIWLSHLTKEFRIKEDEAMKSLGGNRRAVVAVTVWEHWLCCLGLVRKRRDFSSEEVSECVSVLLLLCFGVQGVMLGWVSVEDDEVLISVWPIKCLLFEYYCLTHAIFMARGT